MATSDSDTESSSLDSNSSTEENLQKSTQINNDQKNPKSSIRQKRSRDNLIQLEEEDTNQNQKLNPISDISDDENQYSKEGGIQFSKHKRIKKSTHNSNSSKHSNPDEPDTDSSSQDSDSEFESNTIDPGILSHRDRKKVYASQKAIDRKKIWTYPPNETLSHHFNQMRLNDLERKQLHEICQVPTAVITLNLNPDPDFLYLWLKKLCPTNWQLIFTGVTQGAHQSLINVDSIPRKQWRGWQSRNAKMKLLVKYQVKTYGCPIALFISPSAYTTLDYIRSLRKLEPKMVPENWKRLKIAKLFGKNMKRSEQKEYCRTRKFRLAAGTPLRVSKLLGGKKPPLQVKSLRYLFLDMTPNKLGMTMLDDRELDFYIKKIILKFLSPRIISGDCQIVLVRENREGKATIIRPMEIDNVE